MIIDGYDAFLVELNSEADLIDDARGATRKGDLAGEEPDEEFLSGQRDLLTRWHRNDVHGGGPCICPAGRWSTTTERPF